MSDNQNSTKKGIFVHDDIVTDLRYCAKIHAGRVRHGCIAEAADEIERLRQMKRPQVLYAVRHHDRDSENDPELATLMRAGEAEGPWHDVATGHPDTIWGMLRATYLREVGAWHGIGWAYGGDEIERLRAAGDELATRLRWWTDNTDEAYPDHDALRTWEKTRRG